VTDRRWIYRFILPFNFYICMF